MIILLNNKCISSFIYDFESNFDWLESINYDSNTILAIKQIHSSSHNAICFKYTYEKNRQY